MSASHRPRPGPPARRASTVRSPRTAVLAATAGTVLLLDLISKILVVAELQDRAPVTLPTGYLWLTHARNSGAAFSFAEGATVLFTAVAVVVIVVIVRTASKLRSTAWAISLGLVLGGAAGNLVDRLFRSPGPLRGEVVDWISLRTPDGRMLFPIFNLADSGIVCGGILAVLLAILGFEMDGTRGSTPDPAPPTSPAGPPGRSADGPPPAGPAGPGAGSARNGPQAGTQQFGGPQAGTQQVGGPQAGTQQFGGPQAGTQRFGGPMGARPAPPPPGDGSGYVPSRNPLAGPDGRARG